jgi:CheY-like chemotaxis protein
MGGSARILVVDDDTVICGLIADVLGAEGYEVATACDGAAALRILEEMQGRRRPPPDLILLDMRMPVMDGRAFLAAYRRSPPPHARVVLSTAAADAAASAAEVAADGVLAKPFDLDQLIAVVEAFCPAPAGAAGYD